MKGKEGLLSGRIVWGAMLGGGFVLAGLLVDWLLFSPDFANDQRAIGARRFFYEQIAGRQTRGGGRFSRAGLYPRG